MKSKKILAGASLFIAIFVVGYLIWAINAPDIGPNAEAALASSDKVEVIVEKNGGVRFMPASPRGAALVFYPGARVRPASYAVEMRALAEAGYMVIVPHMPFNMAVFSVNKAETVIEDYPEIKTWAIGGHSLGGAMAASFVKSHKEDMSGILFWASYPSNSTNLRDFAGAVTSISGALDGLATPENVDTAKPNLPDDTVYVQIKGGNHAQFGDYGQQSGDNDATISKEEQWQQIIDASLDLMSAVEAEAQGAQN